MKNEKPKKQKGRLPLSNYFQTFKEGDKVGVAREISLQPRFPMNLQGRTGEVVGKRGKAYIVLIKDNNKKKQYLIEPIHLKKIQQKK